MIRLLALMLVLLCMAAATNAAAAETPLGDEFAKVLKPFLIKHCIECHGPSDQQSGIRYDHLTQFQSSDRILWTLVHEQLRTGAMPPEGQPAPADAERKSILALLERAQIAMPPNSTRRLNRREFAAALRDVTGLAVDFAYGLPGDGKVDGFDTGAEGLQDAADSVAQMMQVTRRAVEGLRFLEPPRGKTLAADLRDAKDVRRVFDAWKADGLSVNPGEGFAQPGLGWLIRPKWLGDRGGFSIRLAADLPRERIVRFQVVVSVQKNVAGLPNPHLWVEVGGRDLAYVEIRSTADKLTILKYEISLSDLAIDAKGLSLQLTNRVEAPYSVQGFPNEEKEGKPGEKIPGGSGLFRPAFDAKTLKLQDQPIPYIAIHSLEIETEYRAAWPPPNWKADVGELGDNRSSAERLLAIWMDRAWRRPVAAAERTRFLTLYDKQRAEGRSFDDSLRSTFQASLLAGSFRYLASSKSDPPRQQFAIASRLSFMLWGSPPDAELRSLAAAGKLSEPALLDAQVDRLLADERSDGFFRPFVTQWLEMGQPITLAMDHIQKQDYRFGRNLKASMQEETIAYVRQLVTENRPARELISSDWTMMNNILAQHYGYDGIEGGQLRKVMLRNTDPRGGGLLSHAGIQSMLCWMGENWVIYRGAWTMRRILDDPPPPPPLEVPELLPSDAKNRGKTFKELLVQHQEDKRCSVCHRKMDPLGFAFQNFDLSGRWREKEFERYVMNDLDGKIEWRGEGKDRTVDSQGRLPRGEAFTTFAEAKDKLRDHYIDDVVRGLLKFLLLYGSGNKPGIEGRAEIRAIMAEQQSKEYPARDLIKAVVKSSAFLNP